MSNKVLWSVIGVVAVVLVVWGLSKNKGYEYATPTPTPSQGASSYYGGSATKTPAPSYAAVLDYSAALQKYAGHVLQFDARCQVTPNNLTVKNGTYIMFDNRSGDARTIKLDNTAYYFAGYGFRIIPMTFASLPHTTTIDCGAAQNVGHIIIQQ